MASRSLAPSSRSSSRTPAFPALLDPFRLMNTLLGDVVSTRPGDGAGNAMLLAQPRMNIDDTGNEIRVTVELPGVSEADVQIKLPFSPNPDQVEASFRDGILTITVPKNAEQRSKQRQIEVKRDSERAGDGSRSSQGSTARSGATSSNSSSGQDQGAQRSGAQRETADTAV